MKMKFMESTRLMIRYVFIAMIFVLGSRGAVFAADLSLSYTQDAVAAIDWDGIGDMDGNGTLIFSSLGESQTAKLHILCNKAAGYQVTLYSSNATSARQSALKQGSDAVGYTTTMDVGGIQNATVSLSDLVLNNVSQPSLDVNFIGGTLPLNGSNQANELVLNFILDAFDGNLRPQGVYTDTITATIALN